MPELPEAMYCSQQICIPPSFPYILRQYAKAAIRSQPADLLRWSTAYFRFLSLNLKPPIKPRLEYPIPKSHFGLTPGWLRALTYQLDNNRFITFKLLWDRWIGACLQHKNLIEVLCLGRFNDPWAVPWYRVVALCAGHLTDNLTQTMILICEILTEEPEGGSSMIPLEVFTDLYKFLAELDCSKPQTLFNLYFVDSLLSLYREPPVIVEKEPEPEIEVIEEEEIVEAEEEKEEEIIKGPEEDLVGVVISCPDIAPDDYKREEDFAKDQNEALIDEKETEIEGEVEVEIVTEQTTSAVSSESTLLGKEEEEESIEEEEEEKEVKEIESVDTVIGYMPPRKVDEDMSDEMHGEGVGEEEEPFDLDHYQGLMEAQASGTIIGEFEASEGTVEEELAGEEQEEERREEFYIEAIPGIGPSVPERLIEAVLTYMKECASIQHGMVMPRNIRHYNCPPLEVATVGGQ